ncbi:conserved hypothetical protein [Hyella patelloides LEGE 07179]|uniref:Uncharacterized protein n=1 Tax=Hyella patelloides LEGE 07179 TaxID=945734 RepID=A0A563W166_9CYAN|nr:hypothetical protein [Hyella patelloides]VEP17428.1 conserved hypothetical protein [Hyella patelloides LEGE 07179]
MNKKEAIQLLNNEGWTKADAQRALELINLQADSDVDEIIIRRAISKFAGSELVKRQRLQAAQKAMVTKRNKEIKNYIFQLEKLQNKKATNTNDNSFQAELEKQIKKLTNDNEELIKANKILQKDNKDLKNIVDAIKLRLTIETKHLLQFNNINEIKKDLVKLLKSTLG